MFRKSLEKIHMLLRGIERDIDHERGGGRKREEGWVEKGEGREKMEGEDMGGDRRIESGERMDVERGRGNRRREDRWGEEIHRERGRVVEGVSGVGGGVRRRGRRGKKGKKFHWFDKNLLTKLKKTVNNEWYLIFQKIHV